MVVFRDDLGVLDACWPERLGHIKRTVYQMAAADRRSHAAFDDVGDQWAVPAGAQFDGGDVLDVGPTVLELLGLTPADDVDGRSLARPITGAGARPRDRPVGPRAPEPSHRKAQN